MTTVAVFLFAPPLSDQTLFTRDDTLDASWQWALAEAVHNHLQFGTQFLWTYGPLGFLETPFQGGPKTLWVFAVVVGAVARVGFVIALIDLVRRSPWYRGLSPGEFAALTVAIVLIGLGVLNLGLEFILAALAVTLLVGVVFAGDRSQATVTRLYVAAGLLALTSLIKSSVFPLAILLIICSVGYIWTGVRASHRQKAGLTVGVLLTYGVTTAVLWFLAYQGLGNVASFVSGSEEIVSGFAAAMGTPGYGFEVILIMILAVVAICTFGMPALIDASRRGRADDSSVGPPPWARPVWTIVILGCFTFIYWKEGVVRQDPGHLSYSVISVSLASLLLLSCIAPLRMGSATIVIVLGLTALVMVLFAPGIVSSSAPDPNVLAASTGLRTMLSPGRYQVQNSADLAKLRQEYRVPGPMLSVIGRHPVAILPYNLTIGPAYNLDQTLLPVSQLYSAYTSQLDHLDASFLQAQRIPFVLMQTFDMDGRYNFWTAPATYNEILSNYSIVDSGNQYVLFKLQPRTTTAVKRSTSELRVGQWITVPSCSKGSTTVSFTLHLTTFTALVGFAYRLPTVYVYMRLNGAVLGPYRFVWPLAPDGLNLSNYLYSGVRWAPSGVPRYGNETFNMFKIIAPSGMFTGGTQGTATASFFCAD